MANVTASKKEAFMRSDDESRQSIALLLNEVNINGTATRIYESWSSTGKKLASEKDYYKELDQNLSDEDKLIKQATALKTNDEKIAFLFNAVKTTMSWNGSEAWGSKDGIKSAWKKRVGNSAEVNAALYHLLKKSGIKAYPMLVSTRENGLIQKDFVNMFQINNLVTYIPVDSTQYYLLDATDKYNSYNEVPYNYLNSYGLWLNKENDKYDLVYIEAKIPARQVIMINADISPDAKMAGTGQIASFRYNRTTELELYKTEGEKKFEEFLTSGDNNIKLTNLKLENAEVDTLPLRQDFNFTYDLNNSDKYIFFSPNIFTAHDNPFLSEKRNADVDFGYGNDKIINGRYKIPAGYSIESLPKNASFIMADRGIRFKRLLSIEDGYITLHYEINIQRTKFEKSDYPALHDFYKKMYEMLNEQIVLKKS